MLSFVSLILLLLAVTPSSAKQLVLKGTPVVRLSATPDESNREVLSSGQQREFQLLITKDDDGYIWESREGTQLSAKTGGIYTYFTNPVNGYMKIGSMKELSAAVDAMQAAGATEEIVKGVLAQNHLSGWMLDHEYFYCEVITQGMFVGTYWGYADEFSP
jgi:hypothetical protein